MIFCYVLLKFFFFHPLFLGFALMYNTAKILQAPKSKYTGYATERNHNQLLLGPSEPMRILFLKNTLDWYEMNSIFTS